MRTTKLLLALGLLGLTIGVGLWGCSPDNPTAITVPLDPVTDGRTNRTVVSLGNSLTAGFQGSGLAITGQLASFPNTLAQLTGSTIPVSPDVPMYVHMPLVFTGNPLEQQKGIGSTPGKTGLFVDGDTFGVTSEDLPAAAIPDWLANASYPLAYDNLGVPGATTLDASTAIDAASSQSGTNSFFDLVLRNSALPPFNTTQLTQLNSHFTKETIVDVDPGTGAPIYGLSIPRVITVWIGNNDLLGGALTGNPVVGENITPSTVWDGMFVSVLDQIAAMAAVGKSQVVLGNIQVRLPYFDTVPLGADVGGSFIPWNTEESDVIFVLLPASSLQPALGPDYLPGGSEQIPGTLTFTQSEWDALLAEINAYNVIIEREASARGWGHADVNAALTTLPMVPGPTLNGFYPWGDFTGDGIPEQNTGSAFSLDGIHPSEKGYTTVANTFSDALNAAYGAGYGQADVALVTNIAGFEQVQNGAAKPLRSAVSGLVFTPAGAEALAGLQTLMGASR